MMAEYENTPQQIPSLNFKFTKITSSTGKICKTISLKDGKLVKTEAPLPHAGTMETIKLTWPNFGNFLDNLKLNECPIIGTLNHLQDGKYRDKSNFVTKREWQKLPPEIQSKTATRTLSYLQFHTEKHHEDNLDVDGNLVMLDIDRIDLCGVDGTESVEDGLGIVLSHVLTDLTDLHKIKSGFWLKPSAGACIKLEDNFLSGLSGCHIYFILPLCYEVEHFKKYVENTLWCNGGGYVKVTSSGSIKLNTYIDTSVLSPERLDFISGSDCKDGLTQDRGPSIYFPSLNKEATPTFLYDKTQAQEKQHHAKNSITVQSTVQKTKTAWRTARKTIASSTPRIITAGMDSACGNYVLTDRNLDHFEKMVEVKNRGGNSEFGILPGSYPLQLDTGEMLTVWQILINPQKYNKVTMLDPIDPRPEEQNKAVLYCDQDTITLFTQKRGGELYHLAHDFIGLCEMINYTEEATLVKKLGADWLDIVCGKVIGSGTQSISNAERLELLNIVRGKFDYTKAEIKEKFNASVEDRNLAMAEKVFEQWNQDYSCVNMQGKFRIMEEKSNPAEDSSNYVFMTVADFANSMKNRKIFSWKDGKSKLLNNPAEAWLSWEGRKEYSGITFDPSTHEKEVNGWLNMFHGFSVERTAMFNRTCNGKQCDGKGCISWFKSTGILSCRTGSDMQLNTWGCGAKSDGVVWWLRHLFENICRGDEYNFTWVLDWICDLFQNAGGELKGTAVAMIGGQGCGKGMIANTIEKLMGRHAFHANTMESVVGRFNAPLIDKIFVYCDESVWAGDKAKEGALKTLISERMKAVEYKGIDALMVRNYCHVMASSNKSWAVPVDTDERRWCVLNCYDGYSPEIAGGKKSGAWFAKISEVSTVLGALLDELMNSEITSNLRSIPDTEGLREQKAMNLDLEHLALMTLGDKLSRLDYLLRNPNELAQTKQTIDFHAYHAFDLYPEEDIHEFLKINLPLDLEGNVQPVFVIKGVFLDQIVQNKWFKNDARSRYLKQGQIGRCFEKFFSGSLDNTRVNLRFGGVKSRGFQIGNIDNFVNSLEFL